MSKMAKMNAPAVEAVCAMSPEELIREAIAGITELTDYPADSEEAHVLAQGLRAIALILLAVETRRNAREQGGG